MGIWLAWCLFITGSLWLTLGIHWGANIAYQFFSNAVTLNSIRETGMENYVLAIFYGIGFLMMWVLNKYNLMQGFIIKEPGITK